MKHYLAVDIGGTSIKCGVVNENGEILKQSSCLTDVEKGPDHIIYNITREVSKLKEELNLNFSSIGVCSPGVVNSDKGTIAFAGPNTEKLGGGFKIREAIEQSLGLKCSIDNDVNCAAIGELYFGAGKNYKNFICAAFGTGIGGGIVINKQIYRGTHFAAGEIGMMKSFDKNSYFEKEASSINLVKKANAQFHKEITGISFFEYYKTDKAINSVYNEWIDVCATYLLNVICVLDPDAIIIGGGISNDADFFLGDMQKALDKKLFYDVGVKIVKAELGSKANIVGAASLAISDE